MNSNVKFQRRSIALSMFGSGDAIQGSDHLRFPWFAVEPAEGLISRLLHRAEVSRDQLCALANKNTPSQFAKGQISSELQRVTHELDGWGDYEYKALMTAHASVALGESLAEPISIGPFSPPWNRVEHDDPPERVILECLRLLTSRDVTSEIPRTKPIAPVGVAWLGLSRAHLFYESPWPGQGRQGPEKTACVWRSALISPSGTLRELAWSWRAWETWKKVQEIYSDGLQKGLFEKEVACALAFLKRRAPISQVELQGHLMEVTPLLQEAPTYFPRCWDKSWGTKKVNFLECLRAARLAGVLVDDLKLACGDDPSRMVSLMIKRGDADQKMLGNRIKTLRKDGRYFLLPLIGTGRSDFGAEARYE